MRHRKWGSYETPVPGPGSYDPEKSHKGADPAYTISPEKLNAIGDRFTPGPTDYELYSPKTPMRSTFGSTFRSFTYETEVPGPGTYGEG
jgi:hypothetical protein